MSCVDGPGIIARVTAFLHRRGANIVQSDQYSTGPTGGRFFLRTEFHLPGLRGELGSLDDEEATMDTLVLIGCSSTRRMGRHLVTLRPRRRREEPS